MSDDDRGYRFCPRCATTLAQQGSAEDGGAKIRLRCPACGWTHWNNPTPVLAAVIECVDRDPAEGRILLARNAAWRGRMFGLVTGFMEAGETPEAGIAREVAEETSLAVDALALIGVYDFQRMNQVIIAYHVRAHGPIALSPELAEVRLFTPETVRCWRAGTGHALADWLRARGHEPRFIELPPRS
jgi:NADH pyrophosphatase NudC (nudix superfamily)